MPNQSERIRFTPPATLSGKQEFRVGVVKVGAGGDPTVRLELWENGVSRTIATAEIVVSGSAIVSLQWSATDLSTTTNPAVECFVHVTGAATDGQVEIESAQWKPNTDQVTPVTSYAVGMIGI